MAGSKGHSVKAMAFGAGATFVAKRALQFTWKLGARKNPPTDASDVAVPMREAMLWAVLSGATLGVAKTLAARKAAPRPRGTAAGAATTTTATSG